MQLTINAKVRSSELNPRALRRSGKIPGSVYGHNGSEATSIELDTLEVTQLLRKAVINNSLIDLNVEGGSFSGKTLLREVQHHPYKNDIYHLSFFSIATQSKITVEVPLRFIGTSVGVKMGGSLDVLKNSLQVVCHPDNVPEHLDVDVSHLEIGKGVHINEIALPEGVKAATDGSALVVSVDK